jgi:hypothetical protein
MLDRIQPGIYFLFPQAMAKLMFFRLRNADRKGNQVYFHVESSNVRKTVESVRYAEWGGV